MLAFCNSLSSDSTDCLNSCNSEKCKKIYNNIIADNFPKIFKKNRILVILLMCDYLPSCHRKLLSNSHNLAMLMSRNYSTFRKVGNINYLNQNTVLDILVSNAASFEIHNQCQILLTKSIIFVQNSSFNCFLSP